MMARSWFGIRLQLGMTGSTQRSHDALIARSHAIAEDLNSRGLLDLAVPFYRQAIALLVAERECLADVEPLGATSVMEAADAAPDAPPTQQGTIESPPELEQHLRALEDELAPANANTIRELLMELRGQGHHASAALMALLAKTHLLSGDLQAALDCYQQALHQAPHDPALIVNTGAAWLACGDRPAALALLRPLAAKRHTIDSPRVLGALLSNLALAELEAGRVAEVAQLRAELAGLAPDGVPLPEWLDDARRWVEAGHRQDAKTLLVALRAVHPRSRSVLELLAQTLEDCGEFREAALVYRDLLRPSLSST